MTVRRKFEDVALLAGVAANEDGVWSRRTWAWPWATICTPGRMSSLISHFDNEYAALYRNDGGMNFTDTSIASGIARGTQGYVGWGDAFVDFANSGWQDFFLVNGHVYPQMDKAAYLPRVPGAKAPVSESAGRSISRTSAGESARPCRFRR